MDFFCSKSIYIDNHKRDLNEELENEERRTLKLYEKLLIFNVLLQFIY